jgi:hypothetical protein
MYAICPVDKYTCDYNAYKFIAYTGFMHLPSDVFCVSVKDIKEYCAEF